MKTKWLTIATLAFVALGVLVPLGMAPRFARPGSTLVSACVVGPSAAHAIATIVKLGARAVVGIARP